MLQASGEQNNINVLWEELDPDIRSSRDASIAFFGAFVKFDESDKMSELAEGLYDTFIGKANAPF